MSSSAEGKNEETQKTRGRMSTTTEWKVDLQELKGMQLILIHSATNRKMYSSCCDRNYGGAFNSNLKIICIEIGNWAPSIAMIHQWRSFWVDPPIINCTEGIRVCGVLSPRCFQPYQVTHIHFNCPETSGWHHHLEMFHKFHRGFFPPSSRTLQLTNWIIISVFGSNMGTTKNLPKITNLDFPEIRGFSLHRSYILGAQVGSWGRELICPVILFGIPVNGCVAHGFQEKTKNPPEV